MYDFPYLTDISEVLSLGVETWVKLEILNGDSELPMSCSYPFTVAGTVNRWFICGDAFILVSTANKRGGGVSVHHAPTLSKSPQCSKRGAIDCACDIPAAY